MSIVRYKLWVWAVVAAGLAMSGCARPRGELFPLIDPPIVWPRSPGDARITLVGVLTGSDDLKAARSGLEAFKAILRGPRAPIQFVSPTAIAIRHDDVIAVADGQAAAVHIVNLVDRTHVLVAGWEDQRFGVPLGVTWANDRLFVTDALRHEIIELDESGAYHGRFAADFLDRPVGIVYVEQRDELYVVDGGAHCIRRFDLSGKLTGVIGQRGVRPLEFNFPTHIATDGQGTLLVADSGNCRVQIISCDGMLIGIVGKQGRAAGEFALPKGVAFDGDGHVYVSDARFENVQVFDKAGTLLLAFGREGQGLGEFSLPAGIAIDGRNRIWTADSANGRIQVFAYLGES